MPEVSFFAPDKNSIAARSSAEALRLTGMRAMSASPDMVCMQSRSSCAAMRVQTERTMSARATNFSPSAA